MKFLNLHLLKKFIESPSEKISLLNRYFYSENITTPAVRSNKKIALEFVDDPVFFGLMSLIATHIKNTSDINIDLVVTRSLNASIGSNIFSYIKRSSIINYLYLRPWLVKFPSSYKIGFRSKSLWPNIYKVYFYFAAYNKWKKWCSLHEKNGQKELIINDIIVDDLIIDTYLRYYPSANFDVNNKFTFMIIRECINQVYLANKYFQKNKPLVYLTTQTVYLEHGIAVRCAQKNNIKIFSLGDVSHFGLVIDSTQFSHARSGKNYKELFLSQDDCQKKEMISVARNIMQNRFRGNIDSSLFYMKASSYKKVQINQSSKSKYDDCIVVFLHDYFDSPHIYNDMIFTDFWEWSIFTINALISAKVKFYVKPHPNQIKSNIGVIAKLKKMFPELNFLDPSISNSILLKSKVRAAITVYGTISNEFAYYGIPSICCAEHPHIAFDFCYTAKNKNEYINLINKVSDLNFSVDLPLKLKYRKDALEYFSIKNNLHDTELANVSNAFREFWIYCKNDTINNIEDLSNISNKLSSSSGFVQFIENLIKHKGEA
jgi:hypothetical protein